MMATLLRSLRKSRPRTGTRGRTMRVHSALSLVVVGCVLGTAHAGQLLKGLQYGAILTEYYDRAFVPPPMEPARHVYFVGGSIYVRIGVVNRDEVPRQLQLGPGPLEQALDVTSITAPPGAGQLVLNPVGAGERIDGALVSSAEWGGVADVPSRGEVRFHATLAATGQMPPGLYEVRLVPKGAARSRAALYDHRLRIATGHHASRPG